MKQLFAFFITFLSIPLYGQQNPFDSIQYDRVIAYEFQGMGGRIIEYCLENEADRISDSSQLSSEQIKYLEAILISDSSYGNTTAACFDPHLAIVYYRNDSIISTIDICLDCNYLSSSVDIPATRNKMIKVSENYSYAANGFSKQARKSIHKFCSDIGFTKYLKPLTSIIDE